MDNNTKERLRSLCNSLSSEELLGYNSVCFMEEDDLQPGEQPYIFICDFGKEHPGVNAAGVATQLTTGYSEDIRFGDNFVATEDNINALLQNIFRFWLDIQQAIAQEGVSHPAIEVIDFKPGARAKYNWDVWLDGNQHELVKGSDFTTSWSTFRSYIYKVAYDRNLKVRIAKQPDGNVVIQAYNP